MFKINIDASGIIMNVSVTFSTSHHFHNIRDNPHLGVDISLIMRKVALCLAQPENKASDFCCLHSTKPRASISDILTFSQQKK